MLLGRVAVLCGLEIFVKLIFVVWMCFSKDASLCFYDVLMFSRVVFSSVPVEVVWCFAVCRLLLSGVFQLLCLCAGSVWMSCRSMFGLLHHFLGVPVGVFFAEWTTCVFSPLIISAIIVDCSLAMVVLLFIWLAFGVGFWFLFLFFFVQVFVVGHLPGLLVAPFYFME